MIQTTLFNYLHCNNVSIKKTVHNMKQLKQSIIQDYFPIKPKKNTITDYFKNKKNERDSVFDLVLVDIKKTTRRDIACVKRNMHDVDLKYITISYRWGECYEELVETPDYIAHITSFRLYDLSLLCEYIKIESDLKEIPYLWIDAISVDQQNHERKKETILQMSEIYKKAAYILAVPDLHYAYLYNNPANVKAILLIKKYKNTIYKDILNNAQLINKNETTMKENKHIIHNYQITNNKAIQTENEDIKKAYQFLSYLLYDWSNRTWVISEYQIAKEKEKKQGTPLKYIFFNLLHDKISTFFSYTFRQQSTNINAEDVDIDTLNFEVDSSDKFIQFLKSRFTLQSHLAMILNSNTSRNEDRFYAILPSWSKYGHLIKSKSTISNWNITDMTTVRLKLYEFMDDLWDKASLLRASSFFNSSPIIPSYASQRTNQHELYIPEKRNTDIIYEEYLSQLQKRALYMFGNYDCLQHILDNNNENNNKKEYGPIYAENLTDIQLDSIHHRLTIKANKHFIVKMESYKPDQEYLSTYSLKDSDSVKLVYIPFFTYTPQSFTDPPPPLDGSYVFLLGNTDQNRWILLSSNRFVGVKIIYSCCTNNYTFNIY